MRKSISRALYVLTWTALLISLTGCSKGVRQLKDTHHWVDGIEIKWTWVRTGETRLREGVTEYRCNATGIIYNRSRKAVEVVSVDLQLDDSAGNELYSMYTPIDFVLQPGYREEINITGFAAQSILTKVSSLDASLLYVVR